MTRAERALMRALKESAWEKQDDLSRSYDVARAYPVQCNDD